MKITPFILSACLLVCFAERPAVIFGCQHKTCSQASGRKIYTETKEPSKLLDNDFESGMLQPWIDESQGNIRWKVENQTSSREPNNPTPQTPNGRNYLRVERGGSPSFGIAILRSPTFQLTSSENYISFSFWIRSKWPAFTNLELYLARNGNEELHLSLYNYSNISNRAWQSQSVFLKGESSSSFSLVFYAYCGIDAEDAVAIDDIRFSSSQESTTTSVSELTTNGPVIDSTTTPISSVTTVSVTSTTVTTPTATECSAKLGGTLDSSFHCPNDSVMRYPASNDTCTTQYYECINCIATLEDCPGKKIFNSERQDCQPCTLIAECWDECKD